MTKNTNNEIKEHVLVPKHEKLSEKEKNAFLEKYKISVTDLPKIRSMDPALAGIEVKSKDVIKITRKSRTAGTTIYYRRVTK